MIITHLLAGYFNSVESHDQKHQQVQATIQHHNEQTHLDFLEEPVACLHVDVDDARPLQRDEFVFLTENPQMASWIQLEIVSNASDNFN